MKERIQNLSGSPLSRITFWQNGFITGIKKLGVLRTSGAVALKCTKVFFPSQVMDTIKSW